MDCQQVREQLSDYLDGHIVEKDRSSVSGHLADCDGCRDRHSQMRQIVLSLRALPKTTLPAGRQLAMRIMASKEAERRRFAGLSGFLRRCKQSYSLWSNNLAKPVMAPAMGGFATAVVLFSMVMFNFRDIVVAQANDVPTALYTNASVKSTPLAYEFDDVVLDILVDEQGRVIDYSFPDGYGSLKTSALRRRMEHSLLFTQFTPATAFGQPTPGWVRVSFRRSEIDVKG